MFLSCILFKNSIFNSCSYDTFGGAAYGDDAEPGGSGTAFVYNMAVNHTTLILGNDDQECRTFENIIADYADLTNDGCRTWIIPESHSKINLYITYSQSATC